MLEDCCDASSFDFLMTSLAIAYGINIVQSWLRNTNRVLMVFSQPLQLLLLRFVRPKKKRPSYRTPKNIYCSPGGATHYSSS